MSITRRKFVKNISGVSAACCMGAFSVLAESCSPVYYAETTKRGKTLLVDKLEVLDKPFFVVKVEGEKAPVYIVKRENGLYEGFLMMCTHKLCELKATGTFLTCPCHGSEFSNEGKVLNGPATKDLARYKVASDDKNIILMLK